MSALSMPSPSRPERTFYERSVRASWAMGALATLMVAVYAGPGPAAAYALALLWMLVNLRVWRVSLREILRPKRRTWALTLVVGVKALWIGVCVALALVTGVAHDFGQFLAFLLGFNTPFLVMSLKAAGSLLVDKPTAPANNTDGNRAGEHRSAGR